MAGRDQAPFDPPKSASKARVKNLIQVKSLDEVVSEVKSAIWKTYSSPEHLLQAKVSPNLDVKGEYAIELVFDTARQEDLQENKHITQQVWLEKYELASTVPIYQNKDNYMQVEVLEASVQGLALPAVMKLYYCRGFSYLNKILQEALLQVRLASAYTCKLLNVYICRGSIHMFEVRLIMERLKGDLEADIKYRAQKDNHYSEVELRNILECVTEAMVYAKLRVSST